jgi:hypothetical protein
MLTSRLHTGDIQARFVDLKPDNRILQAQRPHYIPNFGQ